MDYTEINGAKGFKRNMRRTPWLKLFPHWWSENDALLNAIGDEVERIKALAFFSLLNAGIKPPVMIWQNSIVHDEHHINRHLNRLTSYIDIQAPLYKTWGSITLTNNTKDDIYDLQIMITEFDGIIIDTPISQNDIVVVDLSEQKVTINEKNVQFFNINEGIPYFKTVQNLETYDENTPLHNAVIRLQISSQENIECDIDVDIQLDNVVFTNEQNIEITGLELIPIEKIELYVKHDFEFNPEYNGWHKVYRKKYDKTTNVLYDMITTQFYTDEFYVHVWFKELQYPYKVGFPCYRDADEDSMFHVNNRLDSWGEQLGLKRRNYKKNIDEKEYYATYPQYYPFDIEQDYWYYRRLTNEYTWNHLAINDVDIKDSEGNNVVRLYSINPFVEDFVVHARSKYSQDEEEKNYKKFIPVLVSQQDSKQSSQQASYLNAKNILTYNDRKTTTTLASYNADNINKLKYQSKELWSFFDLSSLPEDVNIDNIEILVEADSTDNKKDKYSTNTGLIIQSLDGNNTTFIPLQADKNYQLSEQVITYSSNDLLTYIKNHYRYQDKHIKQTATIGYFKSRLMQPKMVIPFKLEENSEQVDDITDVWIYYDNIIRTAKYIQDKEHNLSYIEVDVPNVPNATKLTIVCKSKTHAPFTATIDIGTSAVYKQEDGVDICNYIYEKDPTKTYIIENESVYEVTYLKDDNGTEVVDGNGNKIEIKRKFVPSTQEKVVDYTLLQGPYADGVLSKNESIEIIDNWDTKDLRNVLQKQGLFFRNIFENSNEQSETTINIKNIVLKISYSDKKTNFELTTNVNTDVMPPKIGEYTVSLRNIGEKNLSTDIDIINAPNIQLSQNYIKVENLKPYADPHIEVIDIYPQSPIQDGYYDILTICEDKERRDSIGVFNTGLIDTGVTLLSHHGKYNQPITIKAYFSASGNKITNSQNISFYVNNYLINQSVNLTNNIASITFTPQDYDFITTGLMPIDVKYEGDEKYAGCSARNELFISKDSTHVKINTEKTILPLGSTQKFEATVTYTDTNGEERLVTDGTVSFYLDDIPLGRKASKTGNFILSGVEIKDIETGPYTLWARYDDSEIYSMDEAYMPVKVTGGHVNINVFNINTSPVGTIEFKAKVTDSNGYIVESGCIKFTAEYEDIINIETYGKIINGIATVTEDIDIDLKNIGTIQTDIKANLYESDDNECQSSGYLPAEQDAIGTLTIDKHSIDFEYPEQFIGTQYEPLGFLINVTDKESDDIVNDGTLELTIIGLKDTKTNDNIKASAPVIDGKARIIFNPVIFFKNWDKIGEYTLFISGDESTYQLIKDGNVINLSDKVNETEYGHLYLIAENDLGKQIPFEIDKDNGELIYTDYDLEELDMPEGDHLFYLQGRDLYRISSTESPKRAYNTGTYNIKLNYSQSKKYSNKTRNIPDGLLINKSAINLDLHTYNQLIYDTKKPITCYTSYYDSDEEVSGIVDFYLDGEKFYSSDIDKQKAIIPIENYKEIKSGTHLLEGRYYNDDDYCYTYSLVTIERIQPSINIDIDNALKGHDTTVRVRLSIEDKTIPISGFVNIYLNDEIIQTSYLYGNEGISGIVNENEDNTSYTIQDITLGTEYHNDIIFTLKVPNDIDTKEYILKAEYEGNEFITPKTTYKPIEQVKVKVQLSCTPTIVAVGEECLIPVTVQAENNADMYTINEGYVAIIDDGQESIRFGVKNNIANVRWTPLTNHYYKFQYIETSSYYDKKNDIEKKYDLSELGITLLEKQSSEIIYNEEQYASLRDAIQCLQENGTLIIENEQTLNTSFEITKPIQIEGQNNAVINLADNLILNSIITIYNTTITTNNNSSIINRNKLKIIHSILKANVRSSDYLTINRCLVYSKIDAVNADLNNNWWGQNKCPYNVDNNIILTIGTNNTPAVIVDDVEILGQLIGANGVQYSIPSTDFMLTADTGVFSIDSGKIVNEQIHSTYMDATEEGKVYLTVDNQTVECDIYDYNRKTEIIIKPIHDIPVNEYIELKANIRSCTDNYYENSDINGYVDWYIDNQQVAHSYINNNYSTIKTYMNDYSTKKPHTIKAIYIPYEYYFGSSQEIEVNVIQTNKAIYVSPYGYDTEIGKGTFDAPYATIQHAMESIDTDEYTIYLKDGEYNETNIDIQNHHVKIKAYNDNATFTGTTGECIFNNTRLLTIENINFVNNQVNTLFNNSGNVYIKQSLIKDNNEICNNTDYYISYSAILNNNITHEGTTENCWFGDDTDVQLTIEPSKSIIYDGVIALITAKLNGANGPLEKELPLRIAQFISDDYEFRPMEDYTYSNKASSLLNTNVESTKNKPILTILDTTQYIDNPINIRCHVQNGLRENINGTVSFTLMKKGNELTSQDITTKDGYATFKYSSLKIGEYELICTFTDGNQEASISANITVKKQDIQIKNFTTLLSVNHKTGFTCECVDVFNNPINDLNIDVLIDGRKKATALVENGVINIMFEHNFLQAGRHTLRLFHSENAQYDTLSYDAPLTLEAVDTTIIFEDTKISQNVKTDLEISVQDIYNEQVINGNVTIFFDGDKIYENQALTYGKFIIKDFEIKEKGQHSLIILYSGTNGFYNSCAEKYTISTDIYNVDIKNLFDFNLELNDKIIINHDIVDIASRLVGTGEVSIFFNNIQLGDPIEIKTGHLSFSSKLPTDVKPGVYKLHIYYTDDSDTYLDTIITKTVTISTIKTTIDIKDIVAYPNQDVQVPFSIKSKYGTVNTGIIELSFEDEVIYSGVVSDGLFNYIRFTTPNLKEGTYPLHVKYTDTTGYYNNQETDISLNVQRNHVIIESNYNSYYPQKPLIFNVSIRNKDNRRVNTGLVDIFIDGIKEKEDIPVNNGQASTNLIFNQAKTYKIDILYKDDDYYLNTYLPSQDFLVGRLDIDEIIPQYNEDKTKITEFVFNTVDDYNVTDGMMNISIDDIQVGNYYIKEKDKIIDLDISYLTKGNHTITIEYNSSMTFTDYKNTYDLYIEPKQATINIQSPISVNINSTVELYGSMSKEINGTISFKIGDKYIGSTLVDASGHFSYEYELPSTFTNETYMITAIFEGNPYYDVITKDDIELQLNKRNLSDDEETSIVLSTEEPYYQEPLHITINTQLSNPSINLFIKDLDNDEITRIGRTVNNTYIYTLEDKFTENTSGYKIIAEYTGSPVYNPATIESETFNIKAYTPQLDNTIITGYVNGQIILPHNIFVDTNGNSITSGTVKYILDEEIEVKEENYTYQMPKNYTKDDIQVLFITDDSNKYNDTSDNIQLQLNKNNVILTISTPEYFDLNDTIEITVEAKSNTTSHNIEKILLNNEQYTLTDNITTINYQANESHDLRLNFIVEENDIFNYTSVSKLIPLNRGEYNQIDTSSNVQDIIEATENGGTVIITKSLQNKSFTVNKDLTIKGEGITLSNCEINHESHDLIIDGITFNASTVNSQDNITVKNCTFTKNTNIPLNLCGETNTIENTNFKDNNNTCIKINEKGIHTVISNCIFNHNNASEDGTCIKSIKANELTIKNTQFINNKGTSMNTSCIYSFGKVLIYESLFYNNDVQYDIRLLKGHLVGDICMFADENNINNLILLENDAEYNLNYNYWGDNNIPVQTDNHLIGEITKDNNVVTITTTDVAFNTEEATRNFNKTYTIEVITDGD